LIATAASFATVTPVMPAMNALVCVPWVPILMVKLSLGPDELPMKMLLDALLAFWPAK